MSLLSIIIPVHNAQSTVERTVLSLKNMAMRSREATEIIIVDDGSIDNSLDIIRSIRDTLQPLKFIILKQPNKGTASARNVGLDYCNGEWIFFLDADDELVSDPLPYILTSSNSSALGFSVKICKDSKYKGTRHPVAITSRNHLDTFTAGNPYAVSGVIFKKNRILTYFENDFIYMEDWLFWIMNQKIFEEMKIFRDEVLSIIHIHRGNKSADTAMNGKYRKKVAEKILSSFYDQLTIKQKNNLIINSCIGSILTGGGISIKALSLLPCNAILYLKLIICLILKEKIVDMDIYAS